MDRSGLTRETRRSQAYSPSLSSLEVIHEKKTLPKTRYFYLWSPLGLDIKATPKQTYLFWARSFITKHGVLLVYIHLHLDARAGRVPLPVGRGL